MLARAKTVRRLNQTMTTGAKLKSRYSVSKSENGQEDSLGQFKRIKEAYYPDFDTKLIHLSHSILGTDYFHFANSNPNNVFAFLLRVRPEDNKGYPLILERMIQCGTKSYPVRDLMNIACERIERKNFECLTTSNFLFLPVSSRDKVAFEILRGILGEMMFKPRLEQLDFLDQAFRFEMNNQLFKQKGYVYEKVLSEYGLQSFCFSENINRMLFAGSQFVNSSCGTPSDIPLANYEDFRAFFSKQLAPSRMAFMSYGNLDINDHIAFIENQCLLHVSQNSENLLQKDQDETNKIFSFSSAPISTESFGRVTNSSDGQSHEELQIVSDDNNPSSKTEELKNALQMKSFMKNKIQTLEGPLPDYFARPKQGAQLSMTFLCPEALKNPLDYFGLNVLSLMLSEGTESIMFQNFIHTNKSTGLCAGFGFDGSAVIPSFTIGLKGVSESQNEMDKLLLELKNLILNISKNGFDLASVERLLTLIEVNAKTPTLELGEQMLQDFAPFVNFNRMPLYENQLSLSKTLRILRYKIIHEKFLQKLVSNYFIQNNQRLEVALVPNPEYYKNLILAQNRLAADAYIASSNEEKGLIEHNSYELKEYKQMLQDLSIIPSVPVNQLNEQFEFTQHSKKNIENVTITFIPQPTNGIVFLKFRFDVSDFTEEDLLSLSMIEKTLGRTANKNFRTIDFHEYASNVFGEWKCWTECYSSYDDKSVPKHIFCIEAFALEKNLEQSFNLISQILCDPGFDNLNHVSEILKLEGLNSTDLMIVNALENCMDVAEESFLSALKNNSEFRKVH